ncbi:CRISPR-associated exonuclease Cas4 [Exaiptasia diaphana]|nr:CRISPR-associated exonuclease Cas4 [Exaiptasia diaphana]
MARHQYQPRQKTMLKVWQRTDQRTFCIANALEYKSNISAVIRHYYETADVQATKTKDTLLNGLVDKWDQNEQSFIQVMKVIFPENGSNDHFEKLRFEILKELKYLTYCREERVLYESQIRSNDFLQELQKLCKDENRPVSESAKEICEKQGINSDEVIKAVESKLTKDRGTKLESKTIDAFGKDKEIDYFKAEDTIELKFMNCGGVEWVLQGRADALVEDEVIEVKNRTNRFMQPIYDLIQLQAYLFLYNKEKGVLLERLKGENKESKFEFKEGFWIDDAIPAMKDFVEELQNLIEKSKNQFSEDRSHTSPCKRHFEKYDNSPINKKPCSEYKHKGRDKNNNQENY